MKTTLTAILALLLFPAAALAQPACKPLSQIATIKLEKIDGAWAVPMAINGAPRLFILTGAGVTRLKTDAVKELALPQLRKRTTQTTLQNEIADFARVETLVIGSAGQFSGGEYQFGVVPRAGASDPRVAGALGLDVLTNFDFDLNLATGTLNLFHSDHCEGQVVYWKTDAAVAIPITYDFFGQMQIPVELNGKAMLASLSPSGEANTTQLARMTSFLKIDAESPGVERLPDADGNEIYSHRFESLSLGGLRISNPVFQMVKFQSGPPVRGYFVPANDVRVSISPERRVADLSLGSGTLSKLHIYVASKEKKIYISPAVQGP